MCVTSPDFIPCRSWTSLSRSSCQFSALTTASEPVDQFSTAALARLDVQHLGLQLSHQIAHGLPPGLAGAPTSVVDQQTPMVDRVLVNGAASPPPRARDRGNQV